MLKTFQNMVAILGIDLIGMFVKILDAMPQEFVVLAFFSSLNMEVFFDRTFRYLEKGYDCALKY